MKALSGNASDINCHLLDISSDGQKNSVNKRQLNLFTGKELHTKDCYQFVF